MPGLTRDKAYRIRRSSAQGDSSSRNTTTAPRKDVVPRRRNTFRVESEGGHDVQLTQIKGVLVATVVMDEHEAAALGGMSERDLLRAVKRTVGSVIPEHLIRDVMVGRSGNVLEVAFSL